MEEQKDNRETATNQIEEEETTGSQDSCELLKQLLENGRKQLLHQRIHSALALILVICVVIVSLVLVPEAHEALVNVNSLITDAKLTLEKVNISLDTIVTMSGELSTMADSMDTFINDNTLQITNIMKNIEDIDFEGLNDAIKDLGDVVEPLAKFFNIF